MTSPKAVDLYYDPFDFAIDDDPYPVWRRLREEAPLYYNEPHDFYALSRWETSHRELPNWQTYRSGRGTVMDVIKSGLEVPTGGDPLRGPTACTTCTGDCCRGCSPRGGWLPSNR